MQKTLNLQDTFLNQARRADIPVTVFLMNGYQLRGTVKGFDNFTVVLNSQGKQQLIYKHAISTIAPLQSISFKSEEPTKEAE